MNEPQDLGLAEPRGIRRGQPRIAWSHVGEDHVHVRREAIEGPMKRDQLRHPAVAPFFAHRIYGDVIRETGFTLLQGEHV
jgi:hypothetical protein